jgi:hypothetical protein
VGERDQKGEKREQRADPDEITDLMSGMEREIILLLGEMSEILCRPTSRYELYPRVSSAIRSYWDATAAACPFWPRSEGRPRLELILAELDRTPWKEAQMQDDAWRRQFAVLAVGVQEAIRKSQSVLAPLLQRGHSKNELVRLGAIFKKALREPAPAGVLERTGT